MKKFSTTLLLCVALSAYSANGDSPRPSNPDGEVAGHHYVDLGLPSGTLWATTNIGAESPYLPGDYFAWGETLSRESFKWIDYKFFEKEYSNEQGHSNYTATYIGNQISGTGYDAARSQWGDAWRMPTLEECEELMDCCQMEYVEYSLVPPKSGLRVCGPNGNSIILANTLSPHGGITTAMMEGGLYWTATAADNQDPDSYPSTIMMHFRYGSSEMVLKTEARHDGLSIRPVISRHDISTSVATPTDSAPSIVYENGVVTINGYADGCELTISDISGRNIHSAAICDQVCHLTALSKGTYIVSVSKEGIILKALKIAIK